MARPGRPERNRAARSFRQLRRFHHVINSDKVFGTHRSIVRVLSVVDGALPSKLGTSVAQIEEERRLLYAAMSRAKDELELYVPRRLLLPSPAGGPGQHHDRLERSRFIPPS